MHNPRMIYGYARVSTTAQDETGQVRQLKAAGCDKIFREKITGTTADRLQLGKLMKRLAPGDVVITPAVDRLSRDTTDLLVIAREMQRAGAGIRSLAEPYLDTTSDFAEIIFASLGVAAKLERRCILERTARGRATPRPTASSSAANRSSRRTNRKRPASAVKLARRSAASPAPTMLVRARFRGWCAENGNFGHEGF
jgi:DNA invertase Pin-like site-specific DNA recombinase